jgi:multidrug efflux system outer membrane protein
VLATVEVPVTLPSSLLERRPDVRRAEAELHAATARVGVIKGQLLPQVTITGSIGTQAGRPSNLFGSNTEIHQIFAGLSFPLFAGGTLSNAVKVARARAEQARYQYEQTVLVALQEAQDALIGLRASRDQLAAQQRQAAALRRALELATKRYESGISSYLEVLDVQRSLYAAELAAAQAERQELVSAVQLYRALGGGWGGGSTGREKR